MLNAVVVKHEGKCACAACFNVVGSCRMVARVDKCPLGCRQCSPALCSHLQGSVQHADPPACCPCRNIAADGVVTAGPRGRLGIITSSQNSYCMLTCCLCMHAPGVHCPAGNVHYYQGLHDVASVLLLVAGEPAAFDMLCQLSTGHLRDATRSSLDPVIELLGLMGPIVAAADEELANFLSKQGLPPFYALSWFITWFSHDLSDFGEVRGLRAWCHVLTCSLLPTS